MDLTVSVIGSAVPAADTDSAARDVGRLLAAADAVVVCGGLGGVMAAVCQGAQEAGGRTIGVLPGVDAATANPWVDVALPTGMGEARNVLVVRAGRAVIAVGGGFGTLSEIAFARKLQIPVVGLDTWTLPDDGIIHVHTPDEAVRVALSAARPAPG
ncbi:MAG TPA: TIGR00725 family protein [Euzebyales bacterium]|nr:TIGR00725 family protein [Euzebyales bacterium]